MNGIRGKLAAQAGHAYLHAFWDAERRFPARAQQYRASDHARKVSLVVDTTDEMIALANKYRATHGVTIVRDAGFTVFKEPTITCVGIGPIDVTEAGDDLRLLKLLT